MKPRRLHPIVAALTKKRGHRNDAWESPQKMYDALDAAFHFTLDAAGRGHSKCQVYYPDAFSIEEWKAPQKTEGHRGAIWLNPPYSELPHQPWLERLAQAVEAGRASAAVALLPVKTDTGWFQDQILGGVRYARAICLIRGRVAFERKGRKIGPAMQPSCLVVYKSSALTITEVIALRKFGPLIDPCSMY